MTNLKMLKKEKFATKPINQVSRKEIVDYLDELARYSPTTIKERFRIIKRAFDYAYNKNLFLLLLSTGMRIGEALSLDYKKDIDLENRTITIYKTITKDEDGKYCIGLDTKTPTGRRTIYLSDIAFKLNIIDVDQHFIDSENKNFVNYMKEHNLFNEYYLKA